MALTVNHPTLREQRVSVYCPSIAGTPVPAYLAIPFRGIITEVGCISQGTSTGTVAVAVAQNGGSAISTAAFTASPTGGTVVTFQPTAVFPVSEDDVISFTPSGGTGAGIAGEFYAVVRVG